MKTADAIAEILKREGVDWVIAYPVNHVIEHAARADIRPVIVRQERTGLHMADAISRVTSGDKLGVFAMQHGPGTENAYGGVAQAYSESIPILVMPMGYARAEAWTARNYYASHSMQSVTKSAEPITSAAEIPAVLRRAFTRLRAGRGGPVLVEVPTDLWNAEIDTIDYTPPAAMRTNRSRRKNTASLRGPSACCPLLMPWLPNSGKAARKSAYRSLLHSCSPKMSGCRARI